MRRQPSDSDHATARADPGEQLAFRFHRRGGPRPGAGRPKGTARWLPHFKRPRLSRHHPVLVSTRMDRHVYNLRSQRCFSVLYRAFAAASDRLGTRLIHFAVLGNHIHLIVEATDERALGRAMKGLGVRIARRLNRVMNRCGTVLSDRYHARQLHTPAEVRNAVSYVRDNHRKHAASFARTYRPEHIDPYTSAAIPLGLCALPPALTTGPPPTASPRTWLLTAGPSAVRAST